MLLMAKPGINLMMSYIVQSIQKLLVLLGLLLRLTLARILQQGSLVNHSFDLTSIPALTFLGAYLLLQSKLASFYMTKAKTQQHRCVHATCLHIEGRSARCT